MTRQASWALGAAAPVAAWRARAVGLVVAVAAVAASAQVAVPVPGSPVPMTLQPLVVLAVGGVLGARLGAAALVLYLLAGIAGLPVFAAGGAGLVRLIGPTGGYLLAFPIAAAITGRIATGGGLSRVALGCVLGMIAIHAGGVAQLAILGGDPALAFRMGFVPFLVGDLIKIGLVIPLVLGLRTRLPFGR